MMRAIILCASVALVSWTALLSAQEVHVTSENGVVTFALAAEKPYSLMPAGQQRTPVLSVICQQKGKKTGYTITFSPGGILSEQQYSTFGNSASLTLTVSLGGQKASTNWVAYGNVENFTYYGKTEPERIAFLRALLNAPNVVIEFTPFLTGAATSSTFNLTGLRAEFERHPECTIK